MSKVDVRWKMSGRERLQTFLVSVAMGVAGWIGLGIAETETALEDRIFTRARALLVAQ